MKRNLYCFFLVLFILSACTGAGGQVQTATATQEPTQTPTPERTPTPIPRFAILVPEKYQDCKINLLNPDGTIEGAYKGLEELLRYEQELNIDPNKVSIWNNIHRI